MSFYKPEKLADGVWRITDGNGTDVEYVDMYLVEGSERALLIDCGVTGDILAPTLASLTDKPITLFVAHGHGDHAAAIEQFDDVYISFKENPDHIMWGKHYDFAKAKDITDGMEFALGGVTLTAIYVPGHTIGSFVLLDKARHILFSSDSIGSSRIWMQLPGCLTPAEYVPHIKRLEALTADMDDLLVCVGHSYQPSGKLTRQYITDTRIIAEKVASGEVRGRPATKEESRIGGIIASYGQMEAFLYRE